MEPIFDSTKLGIPSRDISNWWAGFRKSGAPNVHICLEATGQYGDGVVAYLHAQGYSVIVVNPAQIKHYGSSKLRRNKTDKADAKLIAEFCLREKPAI